MQFVIVFNFIFPTSVAWEHLFWQKFVTKNLVFLSELLISDNNLSFVPAILADIHSICASFIMLMKLGAIFGVLKLCSGDRYTKDFLNVILFNSTQGSKVIKRFS